MSLSKLRYYPAPWSFRKILGYLSALTGQCGILPFSVKNSSIAGCDVIIVAGVIAD